MIFNGIDGTETNEGAIDGDQCENDVDGMEASQPNSDELCGEAGSQAETEGAGASEGEAIQESATETAGEVQKEVSGVSTTEGTNESPSEEAKPEVVDGVGREFLDWQDWDEQAERKKDEEAYKAVIAGLERQITDTVQDEERLKASIKATREYRKELLDKYNMKKITGVEYRKRPEKPVASAKKDGSGSTATTYAPDSGDDSWRAIPLAGVIKGIKGLGQKKIDALCHEAPTLGAFEDLRGEASKAFKQFKDVLPKGFGEQLTSDLEEAVWAAIKKHQNGPIVVTKVEPASVVATVEGSTVEVIAMSVEAPVEAVAETKAEEVEYEDVEDTVADEEAIADEAEEWEEDFSDDDLLEAEESEEEEVDLLSEL